MTHKERLKVVLDSTASISIIVLASVILVDKYASARRTPTPSLQTITPVRIDSRLLTKRIGDAAVMLVEFADYQCPYCAKQAADVFPRVRKDLVDTGRISYAYFQFPLVKIHPMAVELSKAAECARQQGRYWQLHDRLFAAAAQISPEQLRHEAESIGLDGVRFETCRVSAATAAAVNDDMALGSKLGVQGTPTFFLARVNPDGSASVTAKAGNSQSFDDLKAEIDEYTAGKRSRWWLWRSLAAFTERS